MDKPKKYTKIIKSPVFWAVIALFIVMILGMLGSRIVHRPDLPIDWTAKSAIATTIMAILTFAAFRTALRPNRVSEESITELKRQNDIAEQNGKEAKLRYKTEIERDRDMSRIVSGDKYAEAYQRQLEKLEDSE